MADALSPSLEAPAPKLTGVQWLICAIAAIGFLFDIYELLMLPLVARSALQELGNIRPGSAEFADWFGLMFYLPAVAGGIFGLLGGYLTDRLGRRRVLTWSILLYACSAFFAGFATSLPMLLFFRCTTFIGVCVEFVAAVAWLAELFPNHKQRERVLGWTQAFSSLGGFAIAIVNGLLVDWERAGTLPAIFGHSSAWRLTLMSGLIPAIPLILIRPFLPESPAWKEKKAAGTLKRPSISELFSPQLRRTTIVTTLMFTCSYAAAFGAIQLMPQIVPGLPEVQAQVTDEVAKMKAGKALTTAATTRAGATTAASASTSPARLIDAATQAVAPMLAPAAGDPTKKAGPATSTKPAGPPPFKVASGPIYQKEASTATKVQEAGGLAGRILLAILAMFIVSRRKLIRVFQIPGLIVMPVVFGWAAVTGMMELKTGMFFAGLLTVAQFSFWGNYLPRVYPLHLRGTGESFAANIGGRMIGTCFAWVTVKIAAGFTPKIADMAAQDVVSAHWVAYTAAAVGFSVYLIGLILSFFLPEPRVGGALEPADAVVV